MCFDAFETTQQFLPDFLQLKLAFLIFISQLAWFGKRQIKCLKTLE